MTPADAARILAVAAIYDRRTVGELDANAWADALNDLDPKECAQAVRRHYRESTTWLMPARIRELVNLTRREARRDDHSARVFGEIEARREAFDPDAHHRGAAACRAAFDHAIAAKHAREDAPDTDDETDEPEQAAS